jgi:FAD/FMN-containing dehydrogenase
VDGLDRREFLAGAAGGALALPGTSLADLVAQPAGLSKRAARALRSAVRGRVLFPNSPGYDAARLVYNLRFDGARPDAVVRPESARDVAAVVSWANRFDVNVVARSGGHSYSGYSTTGRGVVVDLSRLNGVRVGGGRATVGAGAQLIDMYAALARRGLTVPGGTCP